MRINEDVKEGESVVFWGLSEKYPAVAVVGLGKQNRGVNQLESINEDKEAIRVAAAAGLKALNAAKVRDITVESLGNAEAAAEGSHLANWIFQELKTKQKPTSIIQYYQNSDQNEESWKRGVIKANGQNIARRLADLPANLMTPTIFCNTAKDLFKGTNVKVEVHDRKWAESKKMGAFLSVSSGSEQEPKFLELTYNNGPNKEPYVLVGKGVTFDAGGISIKPASKMDEMRADMGGGASVVGAMHTIASLKHETNLKVLVPLTENLINGKATKPGDVVRAMNGKTICIDNTDAEGRLILADALTYSGEFNPKWVVNVATLTGAIRIALGSAAAGCFTNSQELFESIKEAGINTGDRVWQLPLWKHFTKQLTSYTGYDINNVGKPLGGGSCTAAAFLQEFIPKNTKWMHVDIAGIAMPTTQCSYLNQGMTGRPTRTLVELVLSQK